MGGKKRKKNIRAPKRGPDISTSWITSLHLIDRVLRRRHMSLSEG